MQNAVSALCAALDLYVVVPAKTALKVPLLLSGISSNWITNVLSA